MFNKILFASANFFSSYFIFFSFLCIFFACKCIISNNIIEVLYSLICVFILSAGCLFCINVEFLAIAQVVVYVGAIMILFLFSTMLLNFREQSSAFSGYSLIQIGFFLGVFFFFIFELINKGLQALFLKKVWCFFNLDFLITHQWNIDYLYIVDFCLQDIRIFKGLYLEFSIYLIIIALTLLIVMVGSISLCLSSKTIQIRKKFAKV